MRADEAAQRHEQQRRADAPLGDLQVAAGKRRHFRLLAGIEQEVFRIVEERDHQRGIQQHHPHAHAHRTAHRDRVTAAIGLCHHRHHGIGEARAEDEDGEEELARQDDRRQMRGTEAAEDDNVRRVNAELGKLRADQRHAEGQGRPEMGTPAIVLAMRCDVHDSSHFRVASDHKIGPRSIE